MKKVLLLLITAEISMGVASCSTAPELKSVCLMDFQSKMCWTNKESSRGITFAEMEQQQAMCSEVNSNTPCWMAIDTDDTKTVSDALNSCKNPKQ